MLLKEESKHTDDSVKSLTVQFVCWMRDNVEEYLGHELYSVRPNTSMNPKEYYTIEMLYDNFLDIERRGELNCLTNIHHA